MVHRISFIGCLVLAFFNFSDAFSGPKPHSARSTYTQLYSDTSSSRREWMQNTLVATGAITLGGESLVAFPSTAQAVTGALDGNLPDLPPEAGRSYLQYRVPLQIAADYYVFELRDQLGNIDEWGDVNQLFRTNNNKGQGQPNKIERDYTNPMRILGTFSVVR